MLGTCKTKTNENSRFLVIIGVTNTIGRIHVQSFADYVKESYDLMINEFCKFVNVKNSLHWTLSHIAELICKNSSYTLADFSENSFINWILHYRRCTDYLARKTSIDDNHSDCLKVLYIASRHNIRQNSKFAKKKDKKSYITQTIDSFFSLNEDGKKWIFS